MVSTLVRLLALVVPVVVVHSPAMVVLELQTKVLPAVTIVVLVVNTVLEVVEHLQ